LAELLQGANQDQLFQEALTLYGPAVERVARAYEADPDRRLDLLQDIHLALWRSLEHFAQRCSLRTWVFRIAHNVAASHVIRQHRIHSALVSLEEIGSFSVGQVDERALERKLALEQLLLLIRRLKPVDRQVTVLYLEGMDAASIGDIVGISSANVAMKIHRVKAVLNREFWKGGQHAG
jgi:RNA polymerase sigma-70 factor (ECF subfamily)